MRKVIAVAAVSILAIVGINPAVAAQKGSVVTAAFKTLLNSTSNSMDALDQKYEADVSALDDALAAATKAANSSYDQDLLAATNLYAPQITAANQKSVSALALYNSSNKVKVGPGGGYFGGTNLANYLDCLIDPTTLKKQKNYCSENLKAPVPGTGTYNGQVWGDWNPGDITTIQIFNSGEPLVQNGIAAGYIIPLDLMAFDSSRIAYKQALADVDNLTAANGKARTAAQLKRDNAVAVATKIRTDSLAELDDAYQAAKNELEAQQTAANLALLASKRASKDSANFDVAFAIAYKFEYNHQMMDQIADEAWTGEWTYRTIDSIIKVNKLAASGDAVASSYSMAAAKNFNSLVGNAFTNEADFRAALKVLTATYKQITKVTLKF
jgi:hypothetical protein